MSPSAEHVKLETDEQYRPNSSNSSFYTTVEDCQEAFGTFLGKEVASMPQPGYVEHIKSNSLIDNVRFRAIYWLIKVSLFPYKGISSYILIFRKKNMTLFTYSLYFWSHKGGWISRLKLYSALQIT